MRMLSWRALLGWKEVTIRVSDPSRQLAPFTISQYVRRGVVAAEGDNGQLYAVSAAPSTLRVLPGVRSGGSAYVFVTKSQWHRVVGQSDAIHQEVDEMRAKTERRSPT